MDSDTTIHVLGRQQLIALAQDMLDLRIPPTFLAGSIEKPNTPLWPAHGTLHARAVRSLMERATTPDAIIDSLHPNIRHLVAARAARTYEPDAIADLASWWLADIVERLFDEPLFDPAGAFDHSRVWREMPQLRSRVTDEGLVRLAPDLNFDVDGMRMDGRLLYFHPWLCGVRSWRNNEDLVRAILDLSGRTSVAAAIALDGRCLVDPTTYRRLEYRDYWYGRPFRRVDLDNPHKVGVSIYTAPPEGAIGIKSLQCHIAGVDRLEILWSCKEGVKTLQVEEVVSADSRKHGRYLHAEYELGTRCFRHIDGAVMIYTAEDAVTRREHDCRLPASPRAARKPKLFRIDGPVAIDEWASLLTHFFRGNPLIVEYLEGSTAATAQGEP